MDLAGRHSVIFGFQGSCDHYGATPNGVKLGLSGQLLTLTPLRPAGFFCVPAVYLVDRGWPDTKNTRQFAEGIGVRIFVTQLNDLLISDDVRLHPLIKGRTTNAVNVDYPPCAIFLECAR